MSRNLLVLVLAVLSLGGVLALVGLREAPLAGWGYVAAGAVFVVSTVQAVPPVALASRLAQGAWGVPLRRLADLCGVTTVVTLLVFVVLLARLPDWRLRPSIWLDWPGAPLVWDTIGLVVLAVSGVALALLVPRRAHGVLALEQWRRRDLSATILGTLYLMAFVFVQLLLSSDLAMSLVPGWGSPNFAAYQVVSSLEGGSAMLVLLLLFRRRVPEGTFHALGKLLLALALLWFYFTWSELLTYWYGRTPAEVALLQLLMFGPTLWLFIGAALGAFIVPVALLIWNPVRNSIRGPAWASTTILLGLLLDRIRVYVAAWTVAGPVRERLDEIPALALPSVLEGAAVVGILAAALLLVMVALPRAAALPRTRQENSLKDAA